MRNGDYARLGELLDKATHGRLSAEERAEAKLLTDAAEAGELSRDAWSRTASAPVSEEIAAESRAVTEYLRTGRIPQGFGSTEFRAAGEGSTSAGGALVAPAWWQRLQVALLAYGGTANDFQQLETETGANQNWATNDPTQVKAVQIAENTQVGAQDYAFGQGTLSAYMQTSGVQLVSFQLDTDSAFSIADFVSARVAESLGRQRAALALGGTGSSAPLGLYPALTAFGGSSSTSAWNNIGSHGYGSGGYVSLSTASAVTQIQLGGTGSTTTELAGNVLSPLSLKKAVQAVDIAYRRQGAKWYMNTDQAINISMIADGFGRPLYPGINGDGGELMGYEVVIDDNISNLTASTVSGPVFGYLPAAMILRRVTGEGGYGLMRLDQRYADFLQVGYIGWERYDMRGNDLRAAVTFSPAAT